MVRFACMVWLASAVALAQTPRELFDEGTALYAKGEYAAAAAKFEASFEARPVPVTKFNAARSWEQAGKTLKAIDAWQAWLLMSPNAPERPEAERALERLGQKLAKLGVQALTITSLPAGASVFIDGKKEGVTPVTVELTPTQHLLRLEAEGRVPVERKVTMTLERPAVEAFELPAAEPAPVAAVPPAPMPISLPPTQPRPVDAPFAASLGDDAVYVHIDTQLEDVRLRRAHGNPNGECRAPCDQSVGRAADPFFITVGGEPANPSFVLADVARDKRVSLTVKSRGPWLVVLRVVSLVGALTAGGVGLGVWLANKNDGPLPLLVGFGASSVFFGLAILSGQYSRFIVEFPEP